MSVEIDPVELGFHRPFNMEVSQTLKIRNPSPTPVAFKVKTTAPKQYCVRPNSGRIEAGKEVEVTVLLQAMKQEPPLDAKCRDKFLVQSVTVTADKEFANIAAIWQHVDEVDKSMVQEKKIRVVYLPAEGTASAATPLRNGVNGTKSAYESTHSGDPPAYSNRSPSPEATFTPDTRRFVAPSGPASRIEDEPANGRSLGDAKASASNPATSSTLGSATAAVSSAVPISYDEMKAKLAEAQATISSYAQEGGLRMRKVAAGETSNPTLNDISNRIQQGSQGVPLQIVAALCLLSFLLAYLFF